MKTHRLASMAGVLLVAVVSAGTQRAGRSGEVDAAAAVSRGPVRLLHAGPRLVADAADRCCAWPSTWSVFPKGVLWFDYCQQRRTCLPHAGHRATTGPIVGSPYQPAWFRGADDYPLTRLLKWLQLLGWRKHVHAPSRCAWADTGEPESPPATPSEPLPAPTQAESAPLPPHWLDSSEPVDPQELPVHRHVQPRRPPPAADDIGEDLPPVPAPELDRAAPSRERSLQPAVPPNAIPGPERAKSSRRVRPPLAAPRLSDYINTR